MLSVILTELGIAVFNEEKCIKNFPFSEPAEDYVFVKKGKSRLSEVSKFLIGEQKDVMVNDLALNDLLKKKDIDTQMMSDAKRENIQLTKNGKGYEITLHVYEGPQYKIRNITWDGNYIHKDQELLARLDFKKGDVYKENDFQMAISERVSPLYTDEGYFYFQINPVYTPIGKDSLDIHFNLVENNIVHVRKINIKGNEKTYENVIRRELRMYPGDLFSRKKLMDSYRDIFMLNFFENVVPDVIPVSDSEIDIQLEVYEKSTGQANFSMGYNGVYGFTGGGGFEFPNFKGKGQILSINYQRGLNANSNSASGFSSTTYNYPSQNTSAYQSFSISFTEPWLFDTPNLVGGSYFYTQRGQGQSNSLPIDIQQHGGSLRWGRRFKWPDYFFRGSWMMRASNNKYIADESVYYYSQTMQGNKFLSIYFDVDTKWAHCTWQGVWEFRDRRTWTDTQ
mgnify:CR=1 FL=1